MSINAIIVFVDCRRSLDNGTPLGFKVIANIPPGVDDDDYPETMDNPPDLFVWDNPPGVNYDDDDDVVFDGTFVLDVKKQLSIKFYFEGDRCVHVGK